MSNGIGLRADEAERNLIGASILTPEVAVLACNVVRADDFAQAETRTAYAAIARLAERGIPPTLSQLQNELDARHLALLLEWTARVPTPVYAGYDAKAILGASYRRRMSTIAFEVGDLVRRGQIPPVAQLNDLEGLRVRLAENEKQLPFTVEAGLPTTYVAPPAEITRHAVGMKLAS